MLSTCWQSQHGLSQAKNVLSSIDVSVICVSTRASHDSLIQRHVVNLSTRIANLRCVERIDLDDFVGLILEI